MIYADFHMHIYSIINIKTQINIIYEIVLKLAYLMSSG